MKKKNAVNKMGFTLLELLIVILIIGLLSAISIPMYKKAVEKSKVADALSTMQAVSKSEHGWYLVRNNYTKDFANLDIDLYDKDGNKAEDESFDSINYTFTLQDNSIKAERNNGEYSLFKLYEDGNIYCLPQDHYICEQYNWGVNKQLCNSINGAWSNIKTKCYNNEQERCAASETGATWQYRFRLGINICGYHNQDGVDVKEFEICAVTYDQVSEYCRYSTFTGEGSTCIAQLTDGCRESNFYQGAVCNANGGSRNCIKSNFDQGSICYGNSDTGCSYNTYRNGSICHSKGLDTCVNSKFYSGSRCVSSNARSSCNSQYYDDACCEGQYCPANAPKCECPIDENTGKHKTSC